MNAPHPASDALLTGSTPLARLVQAASCLPPPPAILVDLLAGRLGVPGGVLAALELDANLRGALLAAVRLRHGAAPDLAHAWARLGSPTMLGYLVDTALVLHLDCLPDTRARDHFGRAFAVAGALRELARAEGLPVTVATAVGALHGVGEVAMEHALRRISPGTAARLGLGEITLETVERTLRVDRHQLGAALLAMQGLPPTVWQPIGRQTSPGNQPFARLLATARHVAAGGNGYAAVAAADAQKAAERLRRVLCGPQSLPAAI